jgi:ribosomal protein L11 methylase PrmA
MIPAILTTGTGVLALVALCCGAGALLASDRAEKAICGAAALLVAGCAAAVAALS